MNSEERQRLKTNELGQAVQVVGHRLEEHATAIVVGICTVLVLAAGITWWSRQTSSESVSAWTLLEAATSIDNYGEVADTYKNTSAGRWAKLRVSELYLQSGMSNMFSDRELALSDLKRARSGFEELLNEKSIDSTMRERSLWGLALVLETTSDGDLTKAIDAYKQLLNDVPDTIYKPLAEQRVTALKSGSSKDFYAWFAKQNPKPSEARPKDGGLPGDRDLMNEFAPHPPGSTGKETDENKQKSETAPEKAADEQATKPDAKSEEGAAPTKEETPKPGDTPGADSSTPPKPNAPDSKDSGDKN